MGVCACWEKKRKRNTDAKMKKANENLRMSHRSCMAGLMRAASNDSDPYDPPTCLDESNLLVDRYRIKVSRTMTLPMAKLSITITKRESSAVFFSFLFSVEFES